MATLHSDRTKAKPFSAVPVYGNVDSGSYIPRDKAASTTSLDANVSISQGGAGGEAFKPIEDGQYRLLYRVSKLFADLNGQDGYETYLTHQFTINKSA